MHNNPEIRAIGILTSGGDAPGMNAAIRASCRAALKRGIDVYGIQRGYNGLIEGDAVLLDFKSVSYILNHGGTILKTARCDEFMTDEGVDKACKTINELGIDAVIVIGGDGSFKGARELSLRGIPVICIPGTIDNDIGCSDYTIGFDTALNTAVEAIDRLRDTNESHGRTSIVEVMGRTSGHLALSCGSAAGAVIVMIPERKYDMMKDVVEVLNHARESGKSHNIIIVAEGIEGGASRVGEVIEALTDADLRVTILGHVQRGGTPSAIDRIRATQMGVRAVELILEGKENRIIAIKDDKLTDFDINEGLQMKKEVNEEFYRTVTEVSI